MNVPNLLTMSRFVWTVVFIWLLSLHTLGATLGAAFFFTLAAVTDLIDGYWAKKYNQITDFGKIMDPIADKFLILAAFVVFAQMGLVPAWMVALVAAREIGVTMSRIVLLRQGKVIAAEQAGKIKTVMQIVTISVTLLFLIAAKANDYVQLSPRVEWGWLGLINVLMFIAVLLTVHSGAMFFLAQAKQSTK